MRHKLDRLLHAGEVWELHLELEPGMRLTGTVTGPHGPVANAEVRAMLDDGNQGTGLRTISTRTNAEGSYVFPGLPPQPIGVLVVADGLEDSETLQRKAQAAPEDRLFRSHAHSGIEVFPASRLVQGEPGEALQLDLEMRKAEQTKHAEIALTGIVRKPDGTPAPFAHVSLDRAVEEDRHETVAETYSGADGRFSMRARTTPQSIRISARLDEFHYALREFDVARHSDLLNLDLQLSAPGEEEEPRVLTGRVTLPSGQPAIGAELHIASHMSSFDRPSSTAWERYPAVRTGPDGRFQFATQSSSPEFRFSRGPRATGEIVIIATLPGYAPAASAPIGIRKDDELPQDLDLRLELGHVLEGMVVDAAGQGVPRAAISLAVVRPSTWYHPWPPVAPPSVRGAVVASSDVAGHFSIPHLRAATYDLGFSAPGMLAVQIDADVPLSRPLRVQLGRARTVRGVVLDPEGQAVPGAGVIIWRDDDAEDATASRITNADGSFEFVDLERKPHRLYVTPPQDRPGFARQMLHIDAATHDVRIQLQGALTIEGRVNDGEHGRSQDGCIYAESLDGQGRDRVFADTDTDGRFRLAGLAAGRYVVTYRRDWVESRLLNVEAGSRGLRFGPSGSGVLRGVVRFIDRRVADNGWVEIKKVASDPQSDGDEPSPSVTASAWLGENGEFRVEHLQPGRYEITAKSWRPLKEPDNPFRPGPTAAWRTSVPLTAAVLGIALEVTLNVTLDERVPPESR